jgi:hypothetical protein
MPLQKSTIGVCPSLLRIPEKTIPAYSAKVSLTNVPSFTMWCMQVTKYDAIPTQSSLTHNVYLFVRIVYF